MNWLPSMLDSLKTGEGVADVTTDDDLDDEHVSDKSDENEFNVDKSLPEGEIINNVGDNWEVTVLVVFDSNGIVSENEMNNLEIDNIYKMDSEINFRADNVIDVDEYQEQESNRSNDAIRKNTYRKGLPLSAALETIQRLQTVD